MGLDSPGHDMYDNSTNPGQSQIDPGSWDVETAYRPIIIGNGCARNPYARVLVHGILISMLDGYKEKLLYADIVDLENNLYKPLGSQIVRSIYYNHYRLEFNY